MWQLPTVPQPISRIFQAAYQFWKHSVKSLQLIAVIAFIVIGLLQTTLPQINPAQPLATLTLIQQHSFNFIAYGLIAIFFYTLIYRRTFALIINSQEAFNQSLTIVLHKYHWLVIALVLKIASVIIGSILFIVPSLIIFVLLQFLYPAILVEDIKPLAAYKRSCYLVKNNWWRTAAVTFIPAIIYWGSTQLIAILLMIILQTDMATNKNIQVVVNIICGMIYLPFYSSLLFVQYNDLRLRHELSSQRKLGSR